MGKPEYEKQKEKKMEHRIDGKGKQCPLPVVMTKKVLDTAAAGDEIIVTVDNETAVNNLSRLAKNSGNGFVSQKQADKEYRVKIIVSNSKADAAGISAMTADQVAANPEGTVDSARISASNGCVVVIPSDKMGEGDEALGKLLLKGFIFALTQLDTLPKTMIFYNGGAKITVEDSPALTDLKILEEEGVEIITCGTCLNYYGFSDRLAVGRVGNMYEIAQILTTAEKVVRP